MQKGSPPVSASRLLADAQAQALLVTNLVNIRYLSGVAVSAGYMLVTSSGYLLFVDARYSEKALSSVYRGITVLPITELHEKRRGLLSCAVESQNVSIHDFLMWKKKFKNTKFVQSSGLIEEFRRRKKPEELRSIRRACSITRSVLRTVPSLLRVGRTERELARMLEEKMYEKGADGIAFPSIVAFGSNTSRPHHEPTSARLRREDLVQIDCGCSFRGYASDFSEVFCMAEMSPRQKKCLRALRKAKKLASSAIKSGVTNHKLDAIARDFLQQEGLEKYFTHALGHGLGLEIHEGTTLSRAAPLQKLQKNEVITIEPGVYFPGEWGMRIEETYCV